MLNILSKVYEPSSFIEKRFKGYDLGFKTDEDGRPVVLFIGNKDASGNIRGQRYARRLAKDKEGRILKDHWDDKGPATW